MRQGYRAFVSGWFALAVPALLPATAWCVEPAAEPQLPAAVPANNAAAVNPADRAAGGKILVMPFVAVNPDEANVWVGKSVQQSLVADLTAAAPDRVISTDKAAPTAEAALAIARDLGARYLVAGGFVSAGADLRITGQVFDVTTGQPVVALKATGERGQIFHMEDALAEQIGAAGILRDRRDATVRPAAPGLTTDLDQTPAPSTGVRTDGQAAPPTTGYSPYAFSPTPNDIYAADYNRYVYSPPIYYNSYYSPYYATPYSYTPYSGAYLYRDCSFANWRTNDCFSSFNTGLGFGFSFGNNLNCDWNDGRREHRGGRHDGWTGRRSVITNASIDANRFDRGSVNGITVTRGFNSTGSRSIAGNTDAAPRFVSRDSSTRFQSTNFNAGASGPAGGIDRMPSPVVIDHGFNGPMRGDTSRAPSVRGNGGNNSAANNSRASSGSSSNNNGGGGGGHHR
jgi:TolB-like protein